MSLTKQQRYLRAHFKCVVNPQKSRYYDFNKRRYVRWGYYPILGFMCPVCNIAGNNTKHFLIGKNALCESCALKVLADNKTLKRTGLSGGTNNYDTIEDIKRHLATKKLDW